MILKVSFHDNDFCTDVYEACEKFMITVCNGYDGSEAIEQYRDLRDKHTLDDIKSSLVKATYGMYIANHVVRLYLTNDPTATAERDHYLQYFSDCFELEEVRSFKGEYGDNCETAYIDFAERKVTIL